MARIRVSPRYYDTLVRGNVFFYPSVNLRIYVDSCSKSGVRVKIKRRKANNSNRSRNLYS